MNSRRQREAPPSGWGPAEILRTMREDERRFRRPGKRSLGTIHEIDDDQVPTLRDGGEEP